jgi:flagellar hook protein FlgE
VFAGTSLIDASTVFNGTEVANITLGSVVFVVATNGTIASTTTAGYTVTLTAGDFNSIGATPTIRIRHDASSSDFIVEFTGIDAAAGTAVSTVTVNMNELLNAYSIQAKANLALESTTDPAITITSSTFNAADLKALSQKTMTLSVSSAGVVSVKAGTGPTGFTVDATNSQKLDTTGNRNVVLTDGTNSFTVQVDVSTAISQGAGAEIVVDLKELQNSFGLGTAPGGGRFSATMQIFDSLGNAHDLIVDFDKTATNQWEILVNDPVLASTGVTSGTVAAANRSITFNGDGTPASITFPAIAISAWTTGANNSTVAINLGTINTAAGVTQFAGNFALSSIDQNGVTFGGFVGVNIAEDGKVTAVFDNGEQLAIFQLPLSLFANPNGLESVTGNAYRQTDKSGDILLQQAKSGGSGSVASSALESSTVDLADEFTKMITTQRAYSAAAKIITTADEMLEELIRIRR